MTDFKIGEWERHIAILGEIMLLSKLPQALSGTSFATMIGGAISGRILDFLRHSDSHERIRRTDKSYAVEGMFTLYEGMVTGAVDNAYQNEKPKLRRVRERAHVPGTISRCLKDMHRRSYSVGGFVHHRFRMLSIEPV
jgi:hypothetical protein